MRIPIVALALLVGAATLTATSGCANPASGPSVRASTYSVGQSRISHIRAQVPRLLSRHGYEIYREDIDENKIRYITNWRTGIATINPQSGVTADRQIRLTLEAFPRITPIETLYRMELRVESEMRESRDAPWRPHQLSPTDQEELNRLVADLRGEFRIPRH